MQAIKDRFESCKNVFVQYKVLVPVLIGLILSALLVGLAFGEKVNNIEKSNIEVLKKIEMSIDSLLRR